MKLCLAEHRRWVVCRVGLLVQRVEEEPGQLHQVLIAVHETQRQCGNRDSSLVDFVQNKV